MSLFLAGLGGFLTGVILVTFAAAKVYDGWDHPIRAVCLVMLALVVGGVSAMRARDEERAEERREIELEYGRLLEARRADAAVGPRDE